MGALLRPVALAGLVAAACAMPVAPAAEAPQAPPDRVDLARLDRIDRVVSDAIVAGDLPGAVVLVGTRDRVIWQRAYGDRAIEPAREAMTLDTIFDMASLTKVVATTTTVMQLVEDGLIRLNDRVERYIPDFGRHGKGTITIGDLLVHRSGLRPDVDLVDDWVGYDTAIALAVDERPQAPRGERFVYSDINFFVLADIVARLRGTPFDQVAAERVFAPLEMRDTMFNPSPELAPRIAPTEACTPYGWPCEGPDMRMLRGTVHDPTARRMQGVAGHAGLFSTADDLSRFARMLLGGGALEGVRVLSPLTVARMTAPATPPGDPDVRGLGWDIDSRFSSNRGEVFPLGSFGHTGFTGTSIWIDPASEVFVVFLSSRLHPDGGDVVALRARVASIVASSVTRLPDGTDAGTLDWPRPAAPSTQTSARGAGAVRTGLDVLAAREFEPLAGLRVGLLTNHTGFDRDGASTIDRLFEAPNVDLRALFSPEHGIRGLIDANVPSTTDDRTGLPIHSLYGETRRPTAAMLDGLDAIVIDLQDIGARFYTYMTTMAYVMEEAAPRNIKVFVLDRPNPIGGVEVEGPALDEGAESFTGYLAGMPIRHGLTFGELARMFNAELGIGADLTVVEMEGWTRDQWFDETGLAWVNPSPNMRTLYAATLYPGLGTFEHSNISVGRGTDKPFEQMGAPWIDGRALAREMNDARLPGLRFYPVTFTPSSSVYAGEACDGVSIVITDRSAVRPVRFGLALAATLRRLYPGAYDLRPASRLFGSADSLDRLIAGEAAPAIASRWTAAESRWRARRAPYLLYD